jgi:hypothetical protein
MAEIIHRELFDENGEVVGYEYVGRLVRCKDCKWIDLCKDPKFYEYKGANGFCSKGDQKDKVEK